METQKHPFDYDSLTKGTVIPVERLEDITRLSHEDAAYSLAVLRLKEQVEFELESRGRPVTVSTESGALHILTDEEAAVYNHRMFKQYMRRIGKSHVRKCAVDVNQLGPDEKSKHDAELVAQGRILQAMNKERRAIAALSHKRTTPGISSWEAPEA